MDKLNQLIIDSYDKYRRFRIKALIIWAVILIIILGIIFYMGFFRAINVALEPKDLTVDKIARLENVQAVNLVPDLRFKTPLETDKYIFNFYYSDYEWGKAKPTFDIDVNTDNSDSPKQTRIYSIVRNMKLKDSTNRFASSELSNALLALAISERIPQEFDTKEKFNALFNEFDYTEGEINELIAIYIKDQYIDEYIEASGNPQKALENFYKLVANPDLRQHSSIVDAFTTKRDFKSEYIIALIWIVEKSTGKDFVFYAHVTPEDYIQFNENLPEEFTINFANLEDSEKEALEEIDDLISSPMAFFEDYGITDNNLITNSMTVYSGIKNKIDEGKVNPNIVAEINFDTVSDGEVVISIIAITFGPLMILILGIKIVKAKNKGIYDHLGDYLSKENTRELNTEIITPEKEFPASKILITKSFVFLGSEAVPILRKEITNYNIQVKLKNKSSDLRLISIFFNSPKGRKFKQLSFNDENEFNGLIEILDGIIKKNSSKG